MPRRVMPPHYCGKVCLGMTANLLLAASRFPGYGPAVRWISDVDCIAQSALNFLLTEDQNWNL